MEYVPIQIVTWKVPFFVEQLPEFGYVNIDHGFVADDKHSILNVLCDDVDFLRLTIREINDRFHTKLDREEPF